jgi:histidinol-phosphate phosphatase family protein
VREHRAVVWLDRDGTVVDGPGFLRDPAAVRLLPGASAAIRRMNRAGMTVVLVTNQSGIGRGLMSSADVLAVHQRLREILARDGAHLDAIYVCPHVPAGSEAAKDEGCACRKPRTGLVDRARRDLGIENVPQAVVGDRPSDLGLARNIQALGVLVLTGDGAKSFAAGREASFPSWDHVAEDLGAAADWLVDRLGPVNGTWERGDRS